MEAVYLMAIGSGVMAAGAGALALTKPRRREPEARFELRFPSEVTEAQVKAILGGISGMRRVSTVSVETVATVEKLRYFVVLPEREVPMLRGQIRGALPGARLIDAEPPDRLDTQVGLGWRGIIPCSPQPALTRRQPHCSAFSANLSLVNKSPCGGSSRRWHHRVCRKQTTRPAKSQFPKIT